jgi:prepilin-type N-terminal cleavage/methylation domain-containing protein
MRREAKVETGRHRPRGFTLIELSIVLALSAILARALAPIFLDFARSAMGRSVVSQVTRIQEAASWYYIESGRAEDARWPGQLSTNCTGTTSLDVLHTTGYLLRPGLNSWGRPYLTEIRDVPNAGCAFEVATVIPAGLVTSFAQTAPSVTCDAPSAGYVLCRSRILRPRPATSDRNGFGVLIQPGVTP